MLAPFECERLIACWDRPARFDRAVAMGPKGYGVGEYRYWREPIPEPARSLRRHLYRVLRAAAEEHRARPRAVKPLYPASVREFWEQCRAAGQSRPSSILLRYDTGGINHPHRDIYGKIWFPFQAVVVLSRRGRDFVGGEFSVVEKRPGGDERWRAVAASEGDLILFCSRERWEIAGGRRRRVELRHAMRRIDRGARFGLGLVFPLAG